MVGEPRRGVPGDPAVEEHPRLRVVICDDHEVLRHGLRTVLRWARDLVVVAEATDAEEALRVVGSLRPDVTLVGLGARGPVVHELVRGLTALGTRVVLLGESGTGSDYVDALRAGARGYVHTSASPERLVEGVRTVAHGGTVLDAAVTGELLHHLDEPRAEGWEQRPGSGPLTARQQAVCELVAEGLTNAEIAERLQLSRATVKGHVTVALRRLGLRDRTQLAIHVHRRGLPGGGSDPDPLSG